MTTEEIRMILKEIAQKELDWKEDLPSGSLSSELDSMQKMSLVVGIEDRFVICFEPEEEETIDTIETLVSFIHAKLQKTTDS